MNKRELINLDWLLTAKAGSPVPPDVIGPLREAFWNYINTGESIDAGLGFRGRRLRDRWRRHYRNRHLRDAAAQIEASGPSERADLLAAEIKRFMSTSWIRYRHLEHPPEHLSILHRELFRAAKVGLVMPDYRQLIRIL